MENPIYLDYLATTPLDPKVASYLNKLNNTPNLNANPHSNHKLGQLTANIIQKSRTQLAEYFTSTPEQFIFTSGATEAINLALIGVYSAYPTLGKHIISMSSEHTATLAVLNHLKTQGCTITLIDPNPDGTIPYSAITAAITPHTGLISIMHINNELGTVCDLTKLGNICKKEGIIYHVDGAQTIGKLRPNLSKLNIDLFSMSAHKSYGPKGIGALYLRPNLNLNPILHGGGQQNGLRPGTLPTNLIAGFGLATAIASPQLTTNTHHAINLRSRFLTSLLTNLQANGAKPDMSSNSPNNTKIDPTIQELTQYGIYLNHNLEQSIPNLLNLYLQDVDANCLLSRCLNIIASTGSACQSALTQYSHVLQACGHSNNHIASSIRISYGRFTTTAEIAKATAIIAREIVFLRNLGKP